MTHVDDRDMGRSFGPGDSRAAFSRAQRSRATRGSEVRTPVSHSAGRANNRADRKKPNRSHSAVGAAIVASAAMVATFAFILTNGNSTPPAGTDAPVAVAPDPTAPPAAPSEPASANPAPAASTAKADRKPPSTQPTTEAAPNTGPTSPVFKRGQWIAVLDTYPTDAGLEADQLAKGLAGKLIKAGVPAKAMLVNGKYPGIYNSTLEPVTDTWIVYVGPLATAQAALTLCQAPKTAAGYGSTPVCPTYEPATPS